jgi:hypothetical protein
VSQVRQISVWIITAMAGVLIIWNFSKAVSEMHGAANQFLRLRKIRIAGNSGSITFTNRTPAPSR